MSLLSSKKSWATIHCNLVVTSVTWFKGGIYLALNPETFIMLTYIIVGVIQGWLFPFWDQNIRDISYLFEFYQTILAYIEQSREMFRLHPVVASFVSRPKKKISHSI